MSNKLIHEVDTKMKHIGEIHYEINFPELVNDNEEMCMILLERFERHLEKLASTMGLNLKEV
jgi:hypothetical protein